VALKQDNLLKQWMEREKAAVDYARTCDKRIVELEADATRRQTQVRDHQPANAYQPVLEKHLEATTALFKNVTAEIEALRAQLVRAEALYKASPLLNVRHIRLTKLEAVAEMAQAGLAEESRILKKPERALEETILVCEGEDLVPAHWFRLKAALQSLQAASAVEAKKAKH
jgi:hypothetical protein